MMVSGSSGGTKEPDWLLDQALTQIQQLLGAVNNLQHTIAQQGQTIGQLQVQAAVQPPGQTPMFRGPKMATPPIYDGAMATWFMQTGMAQLFRDHFLIYMNTPEFQTQYKESNEPDQIKLLYWDIYKAFGDPNKQATAIQEITTIKQGSQSGEEHIQLFKQSFMRSSYDRIAGIHEFKWSLNSPLLDKCMAVPELLVTLEKWYDLVIQLDCQWRQAVTERKIFATRGGSNTGGKTGFSQQAQWNWQPPVNQPQQQQWRPPAQPIQRDPNAMQVDCNHGPIQCYNCGQTGHMACACPSPQQQQMCLVSTWNSGTDEDRNELWRMVTGSGGEAGGSVACAEEILDEQPVIARVTQTAPCTQHFPFGQ
ncbi:hypothetical protein AMATHDRAFT_9986 [Amanita thiersii Skay4041]|uniref:CCHC-type domain-containing protein n=1 Tax=Amanita thiersii Skay4041 TaxID=703135 RepID=A0A2A9NBX1_9AGAR|nr:hypothetical protein AMATHDRAFT_9986 [Amanita thiersii Skay4041]